MNKKVSVQNGGAHSNRPENRSNDPISALATAMLDAGIISKEQLDEGVRFQVENGGRLAQILVHLGYVSPKRLHEFLESCQRMPSVDLSKFRTFPDPSKLIPKDYAVKNELFPIDKLGRLLTVGSTIPLDKAMLEELEQITGLRVKAVLCNGNDIRKAIQDYYPRKRNVPGKAIEVDQVGPSEAEIRLSVISQVLKGVQSLPTLSRTVQRVQEAVRRADVSVGEVASIIEHDPPLTAIMLRLANSAAFGFRNKITNIQHAATLLGLQETETIVISSAVVNATERSGHFDYDAYWDDALFSGRAARTISKTLGVDLEGSAFTAGLLHDIGRFALAQGASARYMQVKGSDRGEDLLNAENEHIGIAHPEAGYLLAQQWDLPVDIAEAIRLHHLPSTAATHSTLAGITALAAAMAEARHHGLNPLETCAPVLHTLNLTLSTGLQIYSATLNAMRPDVDRSAS